MVAGGFKISYLECQKTNTSSIFLAASAFATSCASWIMDTLLQEDYGLPPHPDLPGQLLLNQPFSWAPRIKVRLK
jgi:hypothetical protein